MYKAPVCPQPARVKIESINSATIDFFILHLVIIDSMPPIIAPHSRKAIG
jgi:hypothetical protein